MHTVNTKQTLATRRQLRKNSTPQEVLLWSRLRNKQLNHKFYRQYSIDPFIVDFCCPTKKVIVEIDGSQHLRHERYDSARDQTLASQGYKVLRFWNHQVNTQLDQIILEIATAISA